MLKFILGFIVALALISLALDSFAQGTMSIYDADGNYKGMVVLPLPPPQWR